MLWSAAHSTAGATPLCMEARLLPVQRPGQLASPSAPQSSAGALDWRRSHGCRFDAAALPSQLWPSCGFAAAELQPLAACVVPTRAGPTFIAQPTWTGRHKMAVRPASAVAAAMRVVQASATWALFRAPLSRQRRLGVAALPPQMQPVNGICDSLTLARRCTAGGAPPVDWPPGARAPADGRQQRRGGGGRGGPGRLAGAGARAGGGFRSPGPGHPGRQPRLPAQGVRARAWRCSLASSRRPCAWTVSVSRAVRGIPLDRGVGASHDPRACASSFASPFCARKPGHCLHELCLCAKAEVFQCCGHLSKAHLQQLTEPWAGHKALVCNVPARSHCIASWRCGAPRPHGAQTIPGALAEGGMCQRHARGSCPQVCEDAPAELEVNLGGAMQRASDVLIPKLLGLFTSPHDGIRAMVSAQSEVSAEPDVTRILFLCPTRLCLCRPWLCRSRSWSVPCTSHATMANNALPTRTRIKTASQALTAAC